MDERVWLVKDALGWTREYLARKGDRSPRVSAEWLLSAATGLSRLELYAHHDRPLSVEERASFRAAIERRAAGEPLQYVTGEVAFRHLVLRVEPGVFIPRPETEVLVDAVLEMLPAGEVNVVDLCTGSGAVAASIAHERPDARVWAVEVVAAVAEVARENLERAGLEERVSVLTGDLFEPLPPDLLGRLDAVVANPPYIPSAELPALPPEVAHFEPRLALDGGPDGLDVARRVMTGSSRWLRPGGLLAMELDERRAADADRAMRAWYEGVRTVRDLAGRDRVVAGVRPREG